MFAFNWKKIRTDDLTKYQDMSSKVSEGADIPRPADKKESKTGFKALPGKENKQKARKKFFWNENRFFQSEKNVAGRWSPKSV